MQSRPTTFAIRPACADDLAELDALFATSYPALLKHDYPPSVLVTAVPLIARAQAGLLRQPGYFVAEDGTGRLLGAGGWTPRGPMGGERAGVGHIRHVVTDYRHVRLGVGRAIMAHTFEHAHSAGVQRLECFSTRTAEPFYAACGFERLGPVQIDLRPGISFPAIAMVRPL